MRGCVGVVEVKQECEQSMMRKFGKLVNMDAMMTIGGNRRLEELKQEKQLKEAEHSKEIKQSVVCIFCIICVFMYMFELSDFFSPFCFQPLINPKGKTENCCINQFGFSLCA